MIDVDEMATDAGRHCRSRRFVTSLMPMVRHASDSGALISTPSLSSTCMVLAMVTSWDCSSTIEILSDEDGTSPTADDFPLDVAAANIASISRAGWGGLAQPVLQCQKFHLVTGLSRPLSN